MWLWKVVFLHNSETLADGFANLREADDWHDGWLDNVWGWESDTPDVGFSRYFQLPVI